MSCEGPREKARGLLVQAWIPGLGEIQGGIIAPSNQWKGGDGVGAGEQERGMKDGAQDSGLSTERMADPGSGNWTSSGEYHSSDLNG